MNASVDPDRSEWDVIVLGGAAAGENAAQYATQFSGLDAVIVEKDLVGGECSYWACMPSKALLRPVEVLSIGRDLPGVTELIGDRDLDSAAVLARRHGSEASRRLLTDPVGPPHRNRHRARPGTPRR
jgi:dihydrolipoamide dehydrogenase